MKKKKPCFICKEEHKIDKTLPVHDSIIKCDECRQPVCEIHGLLIEDSLILCLYCFDTYWTLL